MARFFASAGGASGNEYAWQEVKVHEDAVLDGLFATIGVDHFAECVFTTHRGSPRPVRGASPLGCFDWHFLHHA